MTTGQKIQKMRLVRGLTQKELAGECITRNMLSQIENDKAKPSMRTLTHLAQTLGVSVGWLLSGDWEQSNQAEQAQALFREGQYAACMELLEHMETANDTLTQLRAVCAQHMAREALSEERFDEAASLAQRALAWEEKSLLSMPLLRFSALDVLTRCALTAQEETDGEGGTLREAYLQLGAEVRYHLTMARYHLAQEHLQAAEREIWSIADLPEDDRAEYLILRGRIALRKEQYENAILYFRQAEELSPLPRLLRRELYAGLERCYKETEDYKSAYEYAAKQREL